MKQLLLIFALTFCFLMGNAQQERQYSTKIYKGNAQLYTNIDPQLPYFTDVNKDRIMKTDSHTGYPIFTDRDRYTIAKPDYYNDHPYFTDTDSQSIAIIDYHPGGPIFSDADKKKMKKTD